MKWSHQNKKHPPSAKRSRTVVVAERVGGALVRRYCGRAVVGAEALWYDDVVNVGRVHGGQNDLVLDDVPLVRQQVARHRQHFGVVERVQFG